MNIVKLNIVISSEARNLLLLSRPGQKFTASFRSAVI